MWGVFSRFSFSLSLHASYGFILWSFVSILSLLFTFFFLSSTQSYHSVMRQSWNPLQRTCCYGFVLEMKEGWISTECHIANCCFVIEWDAFKLLCFFFNSSLNSSKRPSVPLPAWWRMFVVILWMNSSDSRVPSLVLNAAAITSVCVLVENSCD